MKYLVKVFILLLAGCNSSEQPDTTASDDLQHILYSGGDIITMSDDSHLEYAEAVVTSNDIMRPTPSTQKPNIIVLMVKQ